MRVDRRGGQGDLIFDQQEHYLDQDAIDGLDLAVLFGQSNIRLMSNMLPLPLSILRALARRPIVPGG
jgi:hypothetical protein